MFMGNVMKQSFHKAKSLFNKSSGRGTYIYNSHDLPLTVHCKMNSVFCVTQPWVIIPHGGYAIHWLLDMNFLLIESIRRLGGDHHKGALLEAVVIGS